MRVMLNQTNELLKKAVAKAGWQLGLVTEKDLEVDSPSLNSFKKQIAHTAFADQSIPIDAIYFSGENPFIYFRQLSHFNPTVVSKLHRKIWNEGRTPLLAIVTPQEIRLYDCFDTPEKDSASLNKLERNSFRDTPRDLKRLGELLHQSKIDSGIIWEEQLGTSIKTHNRVDRKLVSNLGDARKRLSEDYHIPFDVIHDLLGRSLFTLYLEDRGILTPANYPSKPRGVSNFFDLLNNHKSTYKLFHHLEEIFNGDLFPVTSKEEKLINKNPDCLSVINNCFSGRMDIVTGQLSFGWRMFQFQYIPIELISSIYEEFMSEEDEKHKKIEKYGEFYTPQMLVEFVLNEVLPWPDENNKRYDLRILDPACGSGIFLVESYKRLIARWKYANRNKEINEDVLAQLLFNNIYGIEKDTEAIKVTAFSLYLTFLNYMEPKKVLSKVRFKLLVRWKDKKELQMRGEKKLGNNLFQFSTFTKGLEIFENKFDLIVGNPPWKLGKLDDDVKEYLTKNKLPQQIMCAYLHYMPKLISDGVISLISAAKILFNTGEVYEKFRRNLFNENNIDTIINLSVVRDIIFKNANSPGAVIIYGKRKEDADDNHRDYVTYCVPKSIETIKHRQSVVIDASEIKFLPVREILKENSKIFKIAMWGNVRDLKLIERLQSIKSINDITNRFEKGGGLHIKENGKPFGNESLTDHYFIPPQMIQQYYTSKKGLDKLKNEHLRYRTNNHEIFKKPVMLINEGSKGSEFCCSYVDYNCAYKKSTYGISIKNKNANYHKALVACLNSTIATYYFFITSSSWGVDKGGRVQNNDAISFPSLASEMKEETINKLAEKVDEIITIKNSSKVEFNEKERIQEIRKQIDGIIYKELNLSSNEKSLINDALDYSIALQKRYFTSNAEGYASIKKEVEPYSKMLAKTISSTLKHSNKGIWVEIINSNNERDAVKIIALHFDNKQECGSYQISTNVNISKLLKDINKYTYEQHSESIYYRKVVKYYTGKIIYLVKPNQKRFWTISQALNDADDILLDLINQ